MLSGPNFYASYVLHRRNVSIYASLVCSAKDYYRENTTYETSRYVILSTRVTSSRGPFIQLSTRFSDTESMVCPKKWETVSHPYKGPRIIRCEVCSSCLLTSCLRHLTHLNAWASLFATMNKAVDCLGIQSKCLLVMTH